MGSHTHTPDPLDYETLSSTTADHRGLTRREAPQEKPDNPNIILNILLVFDIRWDFPTLNQRYLGALCKTSDPPEWDNAAPICAQCKWRTPFCNLRLLHMPRAQ